MNSTRIFPINDVALLRLEIERLSELVGELSQKLHQSAAHQSNMMSKDSGFFVYEKNINKFIRYDDLIMIKSESNYSTIFYKNKNSILTSKTLKYWEERCTVDFLIRIHKSYIINLKMIKSIELKTKSILLEDGHSALYSRSNKHIISDLKESQRKSIR